jgi:hypothetical protein
VLMLRSNWLAEVHGGRTHPRTGSCPSNRFEDGEAHRDPSTSREAYAVIFVAGPGDPAGGSGEATAIMHDLRLFLARVAIALAGVSLGGLTFACGPAVAPAKTPVAADPFVVVRATSVAAYTSGKAHLDNGELQAALIDLDAANTNDPDNRRDIQQALALTLSRLALQTPSPEPTPLPRTVVVATVPAERSTNAAVGSTTIAPGAGAGPTSAATPLAGAAAVKSTLLAPAAAGPTPAGVAASTGAAQARASATPTLVAWRDPQGRFSLGAPVDWARSPQPVSLFGTSVVQFRDPTVQAELDVAVDSGSRAPSPELYAATMEIAMQQQVPGYAAEQTLPGSTGGNPSVRRVFTFTQRDAAGSDNQARGFQVAVVKGSTPYIISGSAPAEEFLSFSTTFDQMVETFRFS